jgi:ketosteroid isomerase-like protein
MADRDFAAFQTYIADEAIFMSGTTPLRGREAVAASWKRFFVTPAAPFAWKPDRVQVLDSGTLAKSSGPVASPDGKVSQRFNSIWRLDADGRWRVVFDEGSPVCECTTKP